jgi:taurine dioxygenase
MDPSEMRVEPIAGALGAEVSGVDLAAPLDARTKKALEEAWYRHQVLFFRGQKLTQEQHKAFALQFGEIFTHPVLQPLKESGQPEVFVLESQPDRPYVASAWHTDVTFEQEPPMASILRAVTVPAAGGDTMWASMYAAYDALSDRMKSILADLTAVHDPGFFRVIAKSQGNDVFAGREPTVHPVIRTHPVTGRKCLFVNQTFTHHIRGLHSAESEALLGFLYRHVDRPEFSCRFRWEPDSVAMWDNRCTQHRVIPDALDAHRKMERLTLVGDRPV